MSRKTFNIKLILLVTIILGIVYSCQKIYDPEDLDSSQRIAVINGFIDNSNALSNVSLQWASAFGSKNVEPIYGADVTINDNLGNIDKLIHSSGGTYVSSEEIQGVPGRTYFVRAILNDGTIFESEPAIMPETPVLDSVYAHISKQDKVENNIYGDLIVTSYEGLKPAYDVSSSDGKKGFYRFESKVVSQSMYYITNTMFPITVYCWRHGQLNSTVSINSTLSEKGKNVVKDHSTGFMAYIYDLNSKTDSTSPKLPVGWIVTTRIFSISEDAYLYNNQLLDQLEAENRIFDPVPTQLTSNLKCVTDSTQLVLGNFEVASVIKNSTGYRWVPGLETYYIKDLPDFPGAGPDNCDSTKPDWWLQL